MTDQTFAEYLPHIRRRWLEEQQGWQNRRERAWQFARHAADTLRAHGATSVLAFGSLTRDGWYDSRSDIDLAAEGIRDGEFWSAYAQAAAVIGDCELTLVDLNGCSPELRDAILRERVPL